MEFQVHWLSLTIWRSEGYALKMWDDWFDHHLGSMVPSGHGGRGFQLLYNGLVGAKLYTEPIVKEPEENKYFHLELPGSACEALPAELIRDFLESTKGNGKTRIARLDLAWDGVPFKPLDVKHAVEANQLRSRLRRQTLMFSVEPLEKREDGVLGTSSLRLGKSISERMLRVYDKRGPVRIELQLRAKRADKVAWDVLLQDPADWPKLSLGHLRDYVDFEIDGEPLSWWAEFVNAVPRNRTTVTDAREKELERLTDWLMIQVSPSYSAVVDVIGESMMDAMLQYGRQHRGGRFKSILEINQHEEGKT
jgi:DNA relaxase NicK